MKKCFVVCWFGMLPSFFPVWAQSCRFNSDYDFVVFTDDTIPHQHPENIIFYHLSVKDFCERASAVLGFRIKLPFNYKICDFRPAFGLIFKDELQKYDFWGYCDIDLVFGRLDYFLNENCFNENDAIINGGHFTLFRNCEKMNSLFKLKGAIFSYKTVFKSKHLFAFDETTGIYKIMQKQRIKCIYGVSFVDADAKYSFLYSRLDSSNFNNQCFYWENGDLFRTIINEAGEMCYSKIAYIHLQKRKMTVDLTLPSASFWITPCSVVAKSYYGKPDTDDVIAYNQPIDKTTLKKERSQYNKNKIKYYLKSGIVQSLIRLRQQIAGINFRDGEKTQIVWEKY